MSDFGVFDTPSDWCRAAVADVSIRPDCVIDLGAGTGGLLAAAAARWSDARLVAAERDPSRLDHLRQTLPRAEALHADLLAAAWPDDLMALLGRVDLAVCNPPFHRMAIDAGVIDWLSRAGLTDSGLGLGLEPSEDKKTIAAELVFFAQNLAMLRSGGELAIILPDGMLSGGRYRGFRRALLRQHRVRRIVSMPRACFHGTEARTHLLLISKDLGPTRRVALRGRVEDGDFSVAASELIDRADPDFHSWRRQHARSQPADPHTLADIGAQAVRGTLSGKRLRQSASPFFHTSDLPVGANTAEVGSDTDLARADLGPLAGPGDILIARVGTRCLGRVAQVRAGSAPISDCLFRLRVPLQWQASVCRQLASDSGQTWLLSQARGVCARYLTIADLLRFPLRD